MRADGDLTRKGELRATAILDASVRCLARDGFGLTSLQRVADEAGLTKRAVIYYYDSREGLFAHVVQHIGGRFIGQLEDALRDLVEPADMIDRGFATIWAAITTDRALLVAWFGLQAESITNAEFRGAASYITTRLSELLSSLIDRLLVHGRVLHVDRDALEILVVANVQGLILKYLDSGDTPQLQVAIKTLQDFLATVSSLPEAVQTPR
jgi:AcrR family transcriptional regulator